MRIRFHNDARIVNSHGQKGFWGQSGFIYCNWPVNKFFRIEIFGLGVSFTWEKKK